MIEHFLHIIGTLVALIGAFILSQSITKKDGTENKAIVWFQNKIEPWFDFYLVALCIAIIIYHAVALAIH